MTSGRVFGGKTTKEVFYEKNHISRCGRTGICCISCRLRAQTGTVTQRPRNPYHLARIPEWWNICRNEIGISPHWLVCGKNTVTLTYRIEEGKTPIRRLVAGDLAFIITPKQK